MILCFAIQVHAAGFLNPTPIQAQTWPVALQNRDIVAIAKTGSGKTLGYLIPAFVHLSRCQNNPMLGPTVLVLAPTRELATQIQDEAKKFGRSSRVSCTVSSVLVFYMNAHPVVYLEETLDASLS
jgi:ATP-dependent RNA helicase DDX5/DBP2